MKFNLGVIVACGALALAVSCTRSGQKHAASSFSKIRIGLQPNEKSKDLQLFKRELERRLGDKHSVELVLPANYTELVKSFSRDEVDFAFFTAVNFIEAEREAGAKALLKKVYGKDEFYFSAIVVRSDSKIRRLQDLKGKRFGFVDPKSTSGYLFPRTMLRGAGLDAGPNPKAELVSLESQFLGTHDVAVSALLNKEVDAVALWADEPESGKGAWTSGDFEKLPSSTFRVIAVSDPIPNDAFAMRSKYFEENAMLVLQVMDALINMGAESDGAVLKKVFDVSRMATATSRHYDSVRDVELLLKESAP